MTSYWHLSYLNGNPWFINFPETFLRSFRAPEPLICYITGTHAALAREPAEMLSSFASSLLGLKLAAVMEVADDTHCGFLGCSSENSILPALGLESLQLGFQTGRP